MRLKRRHKYILMALLVYWPLIFAATHIPVPTLVRQSGMSDKTMHVLSYGLLTFLVWFTFQPYRRVDWRRVWPWAILGGIVCYGALDEWLQMFVGRGADVRDFFANVLGAVLVLGALTVVSFWPALLLLSGGLIFTVTNLSSVSTICTNVMVNAAFHFLAYGAFTLIWIQTLHRYRPVLVGDVKWVALSLALPVALLAGVKAYSLFIQKRVWPVDIYTAATAIVLAAAVSWAVFILNKGRF